MASQEQLVHRCEGASRAGLNAGMPPSWELVVATTADGAWIAEVHAVVMPPDLERCGLGITRWVDPLPADLRQVLDRLHTGARTAY